MPENIAKMAVSMNELSNKLIPSIMKLDQSIQLEIHNKQLHMEVLKDMKKTLRRISDTISQTSLKRWIG